MLRILILIHVLAITAKAFESDDCPGACHCTMDGSLMLVDCSGLKMTELPEFPDTQVCTDDDKEMSQKKVES